MANSATNVVVGGSGTVYVQAGTPSAPTDLTAPGTAYTALGYISDGGMTAGIARDITDVKVWQSLDPVRKIVTGRTTSLKFELMEFSPTNVVYALGGGTATLGTATGVYTYPAPTDVVTVSLIADVTDGSYTFRFFYPAMFQSGDIEIPIGRTDNTRLSVEYNNLAASSTPIIISNHPAWHS